MSNNRFDQIINVCKVLFLVLFAASIIFYISYNLTDPGIVNGFDPKAITIDDWTVVMEDGTTFHADDPYSEKPAYGESFCLATTLPDEISADSYLCFLCFKDSEVKVDGLLRRDFIRERDVHILGGSVKASYFFVPIYREDAGKTLTISRVRGETERRVYPSTILATPWEIFLFLKTTYATSFTMYLIILAVAFVITMAGVVLMFKLKRLIEMTFAGIAVFITTAWLITDSFVYPLVFDHYHIDGVVSYLMAMLIPLPFMIYMNALQKKRYAKWYASLLLLSTGSFFLWSVLHFTGILPFYRSLYYLDAVLVIDIICCVVIAIVDIIKGHMNEYRYTVIGFMGFAVLSFLQIILIFAMDLTNDGILILLGLLFLLICVVLQQLFALVESDREKRHAMELSDAKTKFLASMSHEIRTPINSILGMNEMILRENHDDAINDYALSVQSAGKMLLALINDVLDFSKIEAGKLEITSADYQLARVLADISQIASERALSKSLRFELKLAPGLPSVLNSDEVRIKQILINLVTNAVKYTDTGSVALIISGHYDEAKQYRLRFDIADTGRGIKEEEMPDLFDAFSRADIEQNRNVEGTGLGLAIVKSIVDSMDGEIRVKSAYGNGSTFSVILPQKVVDETPLPVSIDLAEYGNKAGEYHCDYTAKDAKVLAVDDNATNLSIVRQFLKNTGMEIDCCSDGETALKKCIKNKYDLILLDHMMPDPDGIVTLARIRSSEHSLNRETKAIVLTANAVAGSRQMYLNAGFADYLTKPLDSKLLEDTVKKYLPPEKVLNVTDAAPAGDFDPVSAAAAATTSRLDAITEMDQGIALKNCNGDKELLSMIVSDIINDSVMRCEGLKKAWAERDYHEYRVHAHAIKSNMATIGVMELSERAKKHEYAGRDLDEDFIREDFEAFLTAYQEFIEKLKQLP